ncbi:MAG: hypothetical protein WB681_00735 [Candidatus Cybelea sp.]
MNGLYSVEFEDLNGLLLNGGSVVFDAGRFEGGMNGCHYAGTFAVDDSGRLRAEGSIRRDQTVKKLCRLFGDERLEFEMIMVGYVEDRFVRGLLVRPDDPYATLRFRLTPKIGVVAKSSASMRHVNA